MTLITIVRICTGILSLSILLCAVRLYRGPKLADRVVAMDLAGTLFLALLVLYVHLDGEVVYLDVAVVLALISFLGTVIFARFLQNAPESKSRSGGPQ